PAAPATKARRDRRAVSVIALKSHIVAPLLAVVALEVLAPECEGARPRELRGFALMRVGALLVHEAMLGVVAEDLGRLASLLDRGFEAVDRLGRAPVVLVG